VGNSYPALIHIIPIILQEILSLLDSELALQIPFCLVFSKSRRPFAERNIFEQQPKTLNMENSFYSNATVAMQQIQFTIIKLLQTFRENVNSTEMIWQKWERFVCIDLPLH